MVIDSIAEQYDTLVDRADWINPYFSPEWMRSWWKRQKQDRAPLVLLAYSAEGELLGYWPFVERPGLLGSKGLWPFVYDEANYHFPTCVRSVVGPMVNALEGLIGSFLFVWLPQIPQTFWSAHLRESVGTGDKLTISRCARSSCLVEPEKEQSFEEFWEDKMGPKSRKSFRYDERSLAERGKISWQTCDSLEEVRSVMPTTCLVEVASSKTLENAGLYSIRGKRGFFFELLPELAQSSRVRLSVLRVDDQPIAWQLELLVPGRSYLHHLAYDEEWKKYSPGKQLLKRSMECCWKEGRVFDFLPAPFAYKERYATSSEPAHELHWIHRSLRGRIARHLIRWNMKIRQKMRDRSPGLAAAVGREVVSKANRRDLE